MILDVCCGSKMFYFDKNPRDVIFMDIREETHILCDGREVCIKPDIVGDFRQIPFNDNYFEMVIFDPPHLVKAGQNSWLAEKYGVLNKETWKDDIRQGFAECMRVLKSKGTLVFKWNEDQIKLSEILNIIDYKPLLGNRRNKTHWLIFIKE